MREMLLLATLLLGQLLPNSQFLSQAEKFLLTKPTTPATKSTNFVPAAFAAAPIRLTTADYPANAKAVYSIDLATNEVLASKDADARLQVASLTKLMTAYIILKDTPNLDMKITVPPLSGQVGDSLMGLATGDVLTVKDLLAGLLINSGSDAAQTLAIADADSEKAFIAKMNTAATNLNLTNTHFANPVGWDDSGNFSSAKDLTELTRILLRNKTFAEIISIKSKVVTTSAGRIIPLATTNQLLYTTGYIGVKTGNTNGSGECLISLYKDGSKEILAAVIGSNARFMETDSIKGWILDHFSW